MQELILHASGRGSALTRNSSASNSPFQEKTRVPGEQGCQRGQKCSPLGCWVEMPRKLEKKQPAPSFGKEEIAL